MPKNCCGINFSLKYCQPTIADKITVKPLQSGKKITDGINADSDKLSLMYVQPVMPHITANFTAVFDSFGVGS